MSETITYDKEGADIREAVEARLTAKRASARPAVDQDGDWADLERASWSNFEANNPNVRQPMDVAKIKEAALKETTRAQMEALQAKAKAQAITIHNRHGEKTCPTLDHEDWQKLRQLNEEYLEGKTTIPDGTALAAPADWVFKQGEVRSVDGDTGGQKGVKLPMLGALDPHALMEVAKVAGFGSMKYERYNFAKGYKWSLSYDALQRHLHAFWGGESLDPESGLPHLAHACWHCLALLTFARTAADKDDRFPV